MKSYPIAFVKLGSKFFAKYYINPPRITKDFLNIATLAKFRQIWLHWDQNLINFF